MTALLHPGVYVREVPSGARSIEGVPTSTTIFVGETERGPSAPTKIRSLGEYQRLFGGYLRKQGASATHRVLTRYAIDSFFANGGGSAYVLRAVDASGLATATRTISTATVNAASPGAWANDVYVLASKQTGATTRFRLLVYATSLASGELEFVEDWDRLSFDPADPNFVEAVLERSQYIRWTEDDTFDIGSLTDELTTSNPADMVSEDLSGVRMSGGAQGDAAYSETPADLLARLDGIDDASLLVATPDGWLSSSVPAYSVLYEPYRTYVDARPKQDLFLIADLARQSGSASSATAAALSELGSLTRSTMAGMYWPHIAVRDPVGATRDARLVIPPSGAVAGLFARTDGRRGVWKAPAGTEAAVNGALATEHEILDGHQDDLNPAGVNAIRRIPGAGVVTWGARTLRPTSEWRYISVRRTAMFLRKSIYNGIQWAVFEPNSTQLWDSLRASIDSFMHIQFRSGAFAGSSADEAYFVKVDAETTTEADRAAGIVNILVGFAPLRPAEFVVVQLSQKTVSGA